MENKEIAEERDAFSLRLGDVLLSAASCLLGAGNYRLAVKGDEVFLLQCMGEDLIRLGSCPIDFLTGPEMKGYALHDLLHKFINGPYEHTTAIVSADNIAEWLRKSPKLIEERKVSKRREGLDD